MTTTDPRHAAAAAQLESEIAAHLTALACGADVSVDIDAETYIARLASVDGWQVALARLEALPEPESQWWTTPLGSLTGDALSITPITAPHPGLSREEISRVLGVTLAGASSAIKSPAAGIMFVEASRTSRPHRWHIGSVHAYARRLREQRAARGRTVLSGPRKSS